MFNIFPIFFMLIFFLIFSTIIFSIFRGVRTWSHNNAQPVLTVWAKVVTKRSSVSNHTHHHDNHTHHSHSTSYFVTFEVESGSRMELPVSDSEFGMLVEGDTGKLTFQGTRYHSFNREINR
jgi:lysylphosphatidylglycerol synthetase-like protein (DUF2156 family)